MIFTFIVYNSIFIFAAFGAFLVERIHIQWQSNLCRIFVFLVLWIPAAVRFGIGTDFVSYLDLFYEAKSEEYIEIGFTFIYSLLRGVSFDGQSFFVLTTFLTYAPICFFLKKKYYFYFISFYVLILYFSTYNTVRQGLSASIIIWAISLYLNSKTLKSILVSLFATLFHSSAFLMLPLYFISRLKLNTKVLGLVLVSGIFFIYKFNFIELLFNSDLFLESAYGTYGDSDFASDTEIGSGIGLIINLIVPMLILLRRKHVIALNTRYTFLINLTVVFIFGIVLVANIYVFNRFLDVFRFVPIFLIGPLIVSFSPKYRKLLIVFLFAFNIMLFEKTILTQKIENYSGLGISPYTTIFDK